MEEREIGVGTMIIEWYGSAHGPSRKRFTNVVVDSVGFAGGFLSWEDTDENILNFAFHEPFTWVIEYR